MVNPAWLRQVCLSNSKNKKRFLVKCSLHCDPHIYTCPIIHVSNGVMSPGHFSSVFHGWSTQISRSEKVEVALKILHPQGESWEFFAENFFIFHLSKKIPFLQFCNNCTFCTLWFVILHACFLFVLLPFSPPLLPLLPSPCVPPPPPRAPRSSWIIVSSYCHPLSWICCTNFQTATTFSPVLYSFFHGAVLHFLLFPFQSCRRKRWQSCPCTRGTSSVQAQTPQHCVISWTRHSEARQSCSDMSVYGVYGTGWLAHPPVDYGAERECFQRWLSRFCECQGKDVKMHVMTVCVCVCLLLVCKVGEHPSEEEARLQPPCPHVCGKMFLRLSRQEHIISIVYFHSPLLLPMSLMVCERRVGREEGSSVSVLKFRVCRDYCLAFCSRRLSYSWAFHETSLLEWTSSHLTDTSTEIWLPGIVCKLNGHIHSL